MEFAPLEGNAVMITIWFRIAAAGCFAYAMVTIATLLAAEDAARNVPATQAGESVTPKVIVVVGASGAPEFAPQFREWADRWSQAAKSGKADCQIIGLDAEKSGEKSDRELLQVAIESHAAEQSRPLWIVLVGHGTFDGKSARFNLNGADVSSRELAQWVNKINSPLAVINCTACSGPFLAELSGPRRVVITATRTGSERNFAHFGDFLSSAIADSSADLDKDDQVSLFEAYLKANSLLREYYADAGRLTTEHALLDDNGDRQGTPANWFQGLRPTKSAKAGAAIDGSFARQFVLVPSASEQELSPADREKRDALELQIAELRQRKGQISEAEYLAALEPLAVELAKLMNGDHDKK
jgi:hypothetical protein